MTAEQKLCRSCREIKATTLFFRRSLSSDGLTSRCKSCINEKQAEYLERNRDAIRARRIARFSSQAYRDAVNRRRRETIRLARIKDPEKFRMRWAAWYHKDVAKRRAYSKEWRLKNRERVRKWQRKADLKKRYGISILEFEALIQSQQRCCAACRVGFDSHRPVVDHDHATGKVRGLLCRLCNSSIGMFGDSIEMLARAMEYVRTGGLALESRMLTRLLDEPA